MRTARLTKIIALALLAACSISSALAQETIEEIEQISTVPLPDSIPTLPEPGDTSTTFYVSKANAEVFHELLLAPIATWLKEGKFVARVVRRLGFTWELAESWNTASLENQKHVALDEARSLRLQTERVPEKGLAAGGRDFIAQETDPVVQADHILWNAAYTEGAADDILYGLELSWIGERSLLRRANGVLYRRWFFEPYLAEPESTEAEPKPDAEAAPKPDAEQTENAEKQSGEWFAPAVGGSLVEQFSGPGDVFRQDVLQLHAPPAVFGFSHVSWRYRGPEDDALWMHSPVIGRNRRMYSANRGDPILGGPMAPDDLFVWSGKVQDVEARVLADKIMLVPFPSLSPLALERKKTYRAPDAALIDPATAGDDTTPPGEFEDILTVSDLYQRQDGQFSAMLWNFQTARYLEAAPWVPVSAYFVPRRVWIVEVSPKDPYYPEGRQVVVFDQESMLPVYRVVYDRKGRYKKTVIGAWGLSVSADGKTRFPFIAFVLVVEDPTKPVAAATSESVQVFLGGVSKQAEQYRALLNIQNHGLKPE